MDLKPSLNFLLISAQSSTYLILVCWHAYKRICEYFAKHPKLINQKMYYFVLHQPFFNGRTSFCDIDLHTRDCFVAIGFGQIHLVHLRMTGKLRMTHP